MGEFLELAGKLFSAYNGVKAAGDLYKRATSNGNKESDDNNGDENNSNNGFDNDNDFDW